MPTQPTTPSPSLYRQVQFVPGRILQANEVQEVQALIGDDPSRNTYLLGALYKQGATMNVNPVITYGSGNATITLTPIDNTRDMQVFLNSRWEKLLASSITVSTGSVGATVGYFVNWVLWRVSSDGNLHSITDTTLVDSVTGEAVADMGQLQIYSGADDSGAVEAITGTNSRMVSRNTAPIQMFWFTWANGGVLNLTQTTSAQNNAVASTTRYGLVATSTSASIVASTDDARLSNSRNPNAASVYSASVAAPSPTGGDAGLSYTDATLTPHGYTAAGVTTSDAAGGINSNRIWDLNLRTTLDKCLGFITTQLSGIWGQLKSFGDRIYTLENAPTVDYSWHMGTTLGRTGTNKVSHQPIVNNNDAATNQHGFEVIGGAAGWNAYSTWRADAATMNSAIGFDGNLYITNPDFVPLLQKNGFDLTNYVNGMYQILSFMTTPQWGATLIRSEGNYFIFQIRRAGGGTFEIGWGSGIIASGSVIPLPAGFAVANMKAMASPNHITSNSSNNNDSLKVLDCNVYANGTVLIGAQGTAGVDWPRNQANSVLTANWMAIVWRQF